MLHAVVVASPFEVDCIDLATRTGWSVLVRGEAFEVTNPTEVQRLAKIAQQPWAPGAKAHFVRILPAAVTGRQISARDLPQRTQATDRSGDPL
jgi:uncharacterized protein